MTRLSPAARAFGKFLAENRLSDAATGSLLGVTDVTVYHWRIGLKIPKPVSRRKIEIFTSVVRDEKVIVLGIQPTQWDDGAEERELAGIKPYVAGEGPAAKSRPKRAGPRVARTTKRRKAA